MVPNQLDMFAALHPPPPVTDADVADARHRLDALVKLVVDAAPGTPWPTSLMMLSPDQEFQRLMKLLPADEAAPLWAVWDAALTRLWEMDDATYAECRKIYTDRRSG